MDKYVCSICHYEYDPAAGIPDAGIAPAPPLKISPMISYAPCAA